MRLWLIGFREVFNFSFPSGPSVKASGKEDIKLDIIEHLTFDALYRITIYAVVIYYNLPLSFREWFRAALSRSCRPPLMRRAAESFPAV